MHDTPLNKLAAFNDSVSPDDIKLWKAACAVECDPSTDELVTLLKVCILSASNEACCRGMGAHDLLAAAAVESALQSTSDEGKRAANTDRA